MGPGFMPVVLGVVLAFLGLLIAGTALAPSEDDDKKFLPNNPQWFGWLCIIGGPIAFIILGQFGGMIPAVFACVFVCALGDKTATYKSSLVLAAGITVFGVVLFHYLLNIPFPLIRGVNL
jgi:Tripartite tricarboxylate transporter TctB family